MKLINPATEAVIAEYEEHPTAEVEGRLERAERGFRAWRETDLNERSRLLRSMAQLLRDERSRLGRLLTEHMGKPIAAAEGEADKCAWVCDFYAEHGPKFLEPRITATDASKSYVRFDPLGPVLAIMPWNFPLWQLYRFAAPAVMAGNVGVLKHATNMFGVALEIESLFKRAGFPEGVLTTLLIGSDRVAEVIRDRRIRAVTLTGSDRAGSSVAQEAGRELKKTVLELGGSDPFIVLDDADLETAVQDAVSGRTINSGQSCIAAKRFIVEQSVAEAFVERFTTTMAALRVGDPLDRQTQIGPLARGDLLEDLHDQVQRSIQQGAKLLTGGKRLDRIGYFYAPTVLDRVQPGMAAFDEETFGPVAAVVRARDRDHACELANQSKFGLGAAVYTRGIAAAESLARRIESGNVFINGTVRSDPRLPFGGIKRSGFGRELADFGMYEFMNIKTVWVQ